MPAKVIIGIDPGCTTGVAYSGHDVLTSGYQVANFGSLVIDLFYELVEYDREDGSIDRDMNPHVVVMEDYLGAGKRDKPSKTTLEVIGAVKAVCALVGCQLVMQRPQERKAFVAEARKLLKAKHKDRHAADALAHILAYQWKQTQKGGESGCSGAN